MQSGCPRDQQEVFGRRNNHNIPATHSPCRFFPRLWFLESFIFVSGGGAPPPRGLRRRACQLSAVGYQQSRDWRTDGRTNGVARPLRPSPAIYERYYNRLNWTERASCWSWTGGGSVDRLAGFGWWCGSVVEACTATDWSHAAHGKNSFSDIRTPRLYIARPFVRRNVERASYVLPMIFFHF